MSIDQLQLTLIPEEHPSGQALPMEVREASTEMVARMLLVLVRRGEEKEDSKEGRDESR